MRRAGNTLLYSFVLFLNSIHQLSCSDETPAGPPDYLMELYNKFNRGIGKVDEEEGNANSIFTFYRSGTRSGGWEDFTLPQRAKLDFNISSFSKDETILASNLRVFVDDIQKLRPSLNMNYSVTALTIRTTCKTKIYDKSDVLIVNGRVWRHTKQLKQTDTGQWIKIKVSSVEQTLNNALSNYLDYYHFILRCSISTHLGRGYLEKFPGRTPILSIRRSREPTLVVYTVNNSSKPFGEFMRNNQLMQSRAASPQAARNQEQTSEMGVRASRADFQHRCALTELYLNITKLGWEKSIIHPLVLKINQCAGLCPYPMGTRVDHSTNAGFRAAWYKRFPGTEVVRPCCVPSEYQPFTLILSRGNAANVLKRYDDLIVTKCKCL